MEWLETLTSGRRASVLVKIKEARFTQSAVHLHKVAMVLSAGSQRFAARAVSPQPVDPLSHRYKAVWPDNELRIPINKSAPHEATLILLDHRRRQRTALGSVHFPLDPRYYAQGCEEPRTTGTLSVNCSIFPSLNIKVDIQIDMLGDEELFDEWLQHMPNLGPIPAVITGDFDTSTATDFQSDTGLSTIPDPLYATPAPSSLSTSLTTSALADSSHQFGFDIASDSCGVVFLEILNASNLPKFRTLTGISFDMDPFVIVSFGQRIFKTPAKRHNLNPTYNCKLVFEVEKHERNYDLLFDVWDRDRITFNDHVASAQIHFADLEGPKKLESGLYDLDAYRPETLALPLKLDGNHGDGDPPILVVRVHHYPLAAVRQQLWRGVIALYDTDERGGLRKSELLAMLNSLGSTLRPATIDNMFEQFSKSPTQLLKTDEIVLSLERLIELAPDSSERVILFRVCPMCHMSTAKISQSKAMQHLSVCASRNWTETGTSQFLLESRYVSPQQASRRWYTKVASKFSYGNYQLGAHSANILVQDRITGQISEERMSVAVRLGIRVLYSLAPVETKHFQRALLKYTLRQGIKYSSPSSAAQIEPFIKFHQLDMSDVLKPVDEFRTFNEFFYRKLRPGTRACENSEEPRTAVSCADCRLTVFHTVTEATNLWIKGRSFSLAKLLGEQYDSTVKYGPLLLFRLAPQDYHRVHMPVDGILGKSTEIPGQYYTVNPMAVRSSLDVFGENNRVIVSIQSELFGKVWIVLIGAMMVGSIVITAKENSAVARGDELGYFQFGGSTVVVVFENNNVLLDSDLVANSERAIETLVRVGMSVAHTPDIPEYERLYDTRLATIKRAQTRIAGGGSYLPFSLD